MRTLFMQNIPSEEYFLRRGEQVRWVSFFSKGWRTQRQLTINLSGAGAVFQWFIFVLGKDKNEFPLDIRVIHTGLRTTSRISVRAVLYDQSKLALTGCARVEHRAHCADTYLSFHTLLLSPSAHVYTIPSLEVFTNDAIAGHAATVERLSNDQLYYCASRGFTEGKAQKILSAAFLAAESAQIDVELFWNRMRQFTE